MLLLHRPLSRNARDHQRVTIWVLVDDAVLVRRRMTTARRVSAPPLRWANRMLRDFKGGIGSSCLLVNHERPRTIVQSVVASRVRYDELPASLLQPCRRGAADLSADVQEIPVPTMLPTVQSHRTLRGKFLHHVLSQAEYLVFIGCWREWTSDHPEYADPPRREHLSRICLEQVLMFRLLTLKAHGHARLQRMYNASFGRQRAARLHLGATRMQRLSRHPLLA